MVRWGSRYVTLRVHCICLVRVTLKEILLVISVAGYHISVEVKLDGSVVVPYVNLNLSIIHKQAKYFVFPNFTAVQYEGGYLLMKTCMGKWKRCFRSCCVVVEKAWDDCRNILSLIQRCVKADTTPVMNPSKKPKKKKKSVICHCPANTWKFNTLHLHITSPLLVVSYWLINSHLIWCTDTASWYVGTRYGT